jgi:hypothetical protein
MGMFGPKTMPACKRRLTAAMLGLSLVFAAPVKRASAQVTAAQLEQTMAAMAAEVKSTQAPDGSLGGAGHEYVVGQTALGIIALRAAGAPPDDPVVRRAAAWLTTCRTPDDYGVYQISLMAIAFASVDPAAYRRQIALCANYLKGAQRESGKWGYTETRGGDYSNSQFAVLGLHAAAMSGIRIPDKYWSKARRYYLAGQKRDGGWSYRPEDTRGPWGSMTCAGVASTYLCNMWLHVSRGQCGYYPQADDLPVNAGLNWIARNFTVTTNPGRGSQTSYYLYAMERAGVILARRYFGEHDWYREGVTYLVGKAGGGLPGQPLTWSGPFYDKCFQLMFLGKGNSPLLIHKAQWGKRGRSIRHWHGHRFDAKFLVHFVERELNQLLDWQIVSLDTPLERLMAAPILYISGYGAPDWKDGEIARMKECVAAGGFILVEAVNGNRAFDRGFRDFIAQAFPEEEFEPLPKDHPVYTSYYDNIPLNDRAPLEAIRGPCWISILYAPGGISCPWDVNKPQHPDSRLGVNIVSYVVGPDKLKGKLVRPTYEVPDLPEPTEPARDAFTIGQVLHRGDWQPHKIAWRKVLHVANQKAGIKVLSRPLPIDLRRSDPFQAHMLYLTGAQGLQLTREDKEALRGYLDRGGFLFAEAACSSPDFDRSLRELMADMFPEQKLTEMHAEHPLFAVGEQMSRVNYSDGMKEKRPGLSRPALEYVEVGGRAVVVYSKYDLSSAIDGHPCHKCPSVLEPSASQLALKIVLYGLSS